LKGSIELDCGAYCCGADEGAIVAVVRNFAVVVNNSELVYKAVIEPRRDLYSMNKLVPDRLELVEVVL
jgi:hypothetical protein